MSVDRAELCAVAVYALPIVLWLIVRARRDTQLITFALDVPALFAADLFGVILLATLMPLEVAVLVSRPLWVALIIGFAVWRRRFGETPAWPLALDATSMAAIILAGAFAAYISSDLMHHYVFWDRYWHDPQVAALATQRVPFVNVFEPSALLRYHYAGDVHGAELRALSFYVLSSNRALALSHAIAFALTASTLCAAALVSHRRLVLAAVLGLGVTLSGPIPLQHDLAPLLSGFMYSSSVIISGRPHVPLAALLIVGITCVAAGRLLRVEHETTPLVTLVRLVPTFALMSLMDETSNAACGLALGFAWLIDGRVFASSRLVGFGMLSVLGLAATLPTRMLGGSLSPGGPVQKVEWVAAKVPPAQVGAALPFTDPRAMHIVLIDLLPMLLCCAAILVVLIARPSRALLAVLAIPVGLIVSCTYVAIHLRVNGRDDSEPQRLFVAPLLTAACTAVVVISNARAGSIATALTCFGVCVPAIFSMFIVARAPEIFAREKITSSPEIEHLNDVNCRESAGAGYFDPRPQPAYVETAVYYMYASCRGVFTPGGTDPPWPTKIFPHYGSEQLGELYATMVPKNADIVAVCSSHPSQRDRVCARVLTHPSTCWAAGSDYIKCPLTSDDRAALH